MDNRKIKQFESKVNIILSQVITFELTNSKAKEASITKIVSNKDSSVLKIFVSFPRYQESSLFELQKSAAFLRKRLAANLDTRKCPFLTFELDNEIDEKMKWDKKFDEVLKNDERIKNLNKEN